MTSIPQILSGSQTYRIDHISAGSFDISITVGTDAPVEGWKEALMNSQVDITLKNGDILKGLWGYDYTSDSAFSDSSSTAALKIAYYQYNDYNNLTAWTNINADDITSVKIDGTEILAG